jgi:predicted RNase H-like nuclease (RuvC/YqgF family)
MEREVRRLNAMLEQAALENRRLTEQLGEQPREIEILREEVRSLNDSIEKVSQHSSRP